MVFHFGVGHGSRFLMYLEYYGFTGIVGAALRRDLHRINHKIIAGSTRSYARLQVKLSRLRFAGKV